MFRNIKFKSLDMLSDDVSTELATQAIIQYGFHLWSIQLPDNFRIAKEVVELIILHCIKIQHLTLRKFRR